MSWRKEERRAERGYHHGNLKEALLQAALGLIAEKGAAGFTFADAARMAGVSPAAPYRHFRDRDELLSSIAQRGFEQFEALLTQAWDDGRPDTVTAFERVGKAYLAFARNEPAFYSAMFESGLPVDANPTLMAASERAFAIIRAAAERLAAMAPPGMPRPPAMMMALHIWSMSHGVASLFGRGDVVSAGPGVQDPPAAGVKTAGSAAGPAGWGRARWSLGNSQIIFRARRAARLTKTLDGLGM